MLIVFEGGEGCGKTTQLNLAASWLMSRGHSVVVTREPGGTPFAEDIRSLFKNIPHHEDSPLPLTELFMIMAARSQHYAKVIAPALAEKKIILCDRFLDSSYVYQGLVGKIPKADIDACASKIFGDFVPHLTLVFDVEFQEMMKRIGTRGGTELDRNDNKHSDFQKGLQQGFRRLMDEQLPYPGGTVPKRVRVDSNASIEVVHEHVRRALTTVLGLSS